MRLRVGESSPGVRRRPRAAPASARRVPGVGCRRRDDPIAVLKHIENNRLNGLVADTTTARAWTSGSGTGIIISDGAGSSKNGWIIVRRNTQLTPGQVGIQHIDGPGIQTYENVIYGERRPGHNNPVTSWKGTPSGVVRDNRYRWVNDDGSEPAPWFHDGSRLTVTGNVRDTTIDPNTLRISF